MKDAPNQIMDEIVDELEEEEAEAMKELDKRLMIAQALMSKYYPDTKLEGQDHAAVFFEFFDRVDDFMDAVHED